MNVIPFKGVFVQRLTCSHPNFLSINAFLNGCLSHVHAYRRRGVLDSDVWGILRYRLYTPRGLGRHPLFSLNGHVLLEG